MKALPQEAVGLGICGGSWSKMVTVVTVELPMLKSDEKWCCWVELQHAGDAGDARSNAEISNPYSMDAVCYYRKRTESTYAAAASFNTENPWAFESLFMESIRTIL